MDIRCFKDSIFIADWPSNSNNLLAVTVFFTAYMSGSEPLIANQKIIVDDRDKFIRRTQATTNVYIVYGPVIMGPSWMVGLPPTNPNNFLTNFFM